jgi:division protein 1
MSHSNSRDKPLRQALDPISAPLLPSLHGTYHIAKEVLMGSLGSDYRRSESVRILSDRESSAVLAGDHVKMDLS